MNKFIVLAIASFLYTVDLSYMDNISMMDLVKRIPASTKLKNKEIPKLRIAQKKYQKKKNTKTVYTKALKYPPNSYPINSKKTEDPSLLAYREDIKSFIISDKLQVESWSKNNYYQTDDKYAVFYIRLIGESKYQPSIKASINDKKVVYRKISNNKFEAKFPLSNLDFGDHILKLNLNLNGKEFNTINSFAIRKDYLKVLRFVTDEISSSGDLDLSYLVEVKIPGNYVFQKVLYFKNTPMALTERVIYLDKGEHIVDAQFYGKILYEFQQDGAFNIKHVKVSYVEKETLKMVNLPKQELFYKTHEYKYQKFHNLSFNDPVIREKLAKISE